MAKKKTEETEEKTEEFGETESSTSETKGSEESSNQESSKSQENSKTSKTSKTSESKQPSEKEFEKKVIEFAKKGDDDKGYPDNSRNPKTAEEIGETLRNQGIHPANYTKKISKILEENNLYQNPDLINLKKKLQKISNHFENNKQDKRARRERDRIHAQLRKLRRYFNLPEKEKKKAKR